jgi:predicted nucleotidyltransferase
MRPPSVRGFAVDDTWPYDDAMSRDDVLRILYAHRDELNALGVRTLSLFGSVARDQASPRSDVDLLVEFDRPVGYFHLFRVERRLGELLDGKVDLVTIGGLRPELRSRVLAEAVRAA